MEKTVETRKLFEKLHDLKLVDKRDPVVRVYIDSRPDNPTTTVYVELVGEAKDKSK